MTETHATFEVGDRVVLRGASEAGCGTVTEMLEYGMVRVRWEQPEFTGIHRGEQLAKVQDRSVGAPASRTQRLINVKAAIDRSGKVDTNPELKKLFGQLVGASVAMGNAARMARQTPSAGIAQKLADLDLQIDAIIRRINQILG
jgi:hypothetical protein